MITPPPLLTGKLQVPHHKEKPWKLTAEEIADNKAGVYSSFVLLSSCCGVHLKAMHCQTPPPSPHAQWQRLAGCSWYISFCKIFIFCCCLVGWVLWNHTGVDADWKKSPYSCRAYNHSSSLQFVIIEGTVQWDWTGVKELYHWPGCPAGTFFQILFNRHLGAILSQSCILRRPFSCMSYKKVAFLF
jgi:hypothetical protein